MKMRIKSHCGGLVEIETRDVTKRPWDDSRRDNVVFMHYTVAIYLIQRLASFGKPSTQSLDVSIMASYLFLLKNHPSYIPTWAKTSHRYLSQSLTSPMIMSHESEVSDFENPRDLTEWDEDEDEDEEKDFEEEKRGRTGQNAITHFFYYAGRAEKFTRQAQTKFIDELDRSLCLARDDWACAFFRQRIGYDFYGGDVLCLAICYKLKLYVREKLRSLDYTSWTPRQPLLWYAMNPPCWPNETIDPEMIAIVLGKAYLYEECIDHGHKRSVWEYAIRHFLRLDSDSPEDNWHEVLLLMISKEAYLDDEIECRSGLRRTVPHLLVEQITNKSSYKDDKEKQCLEVCFKNGAHTIPHLLFKHISDGGNQLKECLVTTQKRAPKGARSIN